MGALSAFGLAIGGCSAAPSTPAAAVEPVAGPFAPVRPPLVAPQPKRQPATAPAASAPFLVRLQRGPCLGRCAQYTVQIAEDGAVRFEGQQFVAVPGVHLGQADGAALVQLRQRLASAETAALRDIYRPGQPGCGTPTSDQQTSTLEWQQNGTPRRLVVYGGCAALPASVMALTAAVDAAAGSQAWVLNRSER